MPSFHCVQSCVLTWRQNEKVSFVIVELVVVYVVNMQPLWEEATYLSLSFKNVSVHVTAAAVSWVTGAISHTVPGSHIRARPLGSARRKRAISRNRRAVALRAQVLPVELESQLATARAFTTPGLTTSLQVLSILTAFGADHSS